MLLDAEVRESLAPARAAGRWLSVVTHLDPKYGGLSTAVPQLASSLGAAGRVEAGIAAFCRPGEHFRPDAGLAIAYHPAGRRAALRDLGFRNAVAKADGVHIHGLWEASTLAAGRAAREHAKPYLVSAHGMLEPWALGAGRLKKQVYAALFERPNLRAAACLHALTEAEARSYRAWGLRGPIAVIPNGVAIPDALDPEPFLQAHPALRGRRLVLFLGRLHRKKGVDLLLQAWAAAAPRASEACLVLAGPADPSAAEALARWGGPLEREGRLVRTGMLGDTMKWSALAASELFVLPSHSEGLSMAALEAMGAGLPVLLTPQCNLPEAAAAGAGWEVEPEAGALRRALEAALADGPERSRARGARGAALARAHYSWARVAGQMAELYSLLEAGAALRTVEPKTFRWAGEAR